MMVIEHKKRLEKREFKRIQNEFFKEMNGTFSSFISSYAKNKGYSDHIFNVFLRFDFKSPYELDFEMNLREFRIFYRMQDFTNEEWMRIYGLFADVFKRNHKLNHFIYLFFYDLIYTGPFSEDIETLDMTDELLALMGDDMLRLYNLFDDCIKTHDTGLIKQIADASKEDTIPYFVVVHLANWFNDNIKDKKELGDFILELYITACEKIYSKVEIYFNDNVEIDSMRYGVDTSGFSDGQVDYFYSRLKKMT